MEISISMGTSHKIQTNFIMKITKIVSIVQITEFKR